MNTTKAAKARNKPLTLALGPIAARVLSLYAIVAMHAWFIIKLALPSENGALELVTGLCALTGLVASIAFFVSTYGVLANAPNEMLDEREQYERNSAYFGAFKYVIAMILFGSIGSEFCAKLFRFNLSVAVMQNYLTLMFATALVLPAGLLAWRDRVLDKE